MPTSVVQSSFSTHQSIRNRPSVRGPLPTRKLHYSDNFELVAMRHREFRRSPNPQKEELRRFTPIAASSAGYFLSMNRALCLLHGYEHGDLMTYALVWTTNFLGLHARDESIAKPDENYKLLRVYLRQRFSELRTLLSKKGRSCFPEVDALAIVQPADSSQD